MSLSSIPRSKARAFLLIGALLVALVLAVAPAAFAAPGGPSAHQQLESSVAAPESVDNYGTFNNPDYYYANITNAPDGTKYRQAGLSPDGTKIAAVKQVGTTPASGWWEIVLMNADGSNQTIVSPDDSGTGDIYQYTNPFWSDDGTLVGFVEGHSANPNKVMVYNLASGARSYIYEPTTTDVSNPDFLGASKTKIIFWDHGVGPGADLFTWDGATLTNITNSADYYEYEPVSNADGTKIVYWSGESTAEPVDHTHTLTYAGGVWTKDVNFTPIAGTYWSYWTTPAATQIATTRIVNYNGTVDIELWDNTGVFVADLSGPGYTGGADHWNFFGSMPQGLHGEFVITSNSQRAVLNSGRDIIIAAPRSELFVATTGSDANPGTEAAPFKTIGKAITEATVGATIHVGYGTYVEHVVVNKSVTLDGSYNDAVGATIDGGGTGTVVDITANNVTVKGFNIQRSGANAAVGDSGVKLTGVTGCSVLSNLVSDSWEGALANGILLVNADNNTVTGNSVYNYGAYGLAVVAGTGNTLANNNFTPRDSASLDAIALANQGEVGGSVANGSTGNLVKANTVSAWTGGRDGIFLGENCDTNQIINNLLSGIKSIAISAWRSGGHTITGNSVAFAATGLRLLGSSDNTVTDNSFMQGEVGIKVDASWQSGVWYDSQNNVIHSNNLSANTTYGVQVGSEQVSSVNALYNWWGVSGGPGVDEFGEHGSNVTAKVLYDPWWRDLAMTNLVFPAGGGTYPGGLTVSHDGATINLNGATVGAGSPAFIITADDVTINGVGTLDGNGSTFPAVLVNAGADNFALQNVEVKGWADGVQVAGTVTSLKIVNNFIHNNTDAGLQVDAAPVAGSVVTIQGNLFKANGGNGVQNDGGASLTAELNSWGAVAGPAVGDGVSANVDADPFTFAEVYLDSDPATPGQQVTRNLTQSVGAWQPFDVEVQADAAHVYGITFKVSYVAAELTYNGATFVGPFSGRCLPLSGLAANEIGYSCNLLAAWNGGSIATLNFTPTGAGLTGVGAWSTTLDVDHVTTVAGTEKGAAVLLNNVKGATPGDRDITDAVDGTITITPVAGYTGFIDVQGRADDSGAVLKVYSTNGLVAPALATATSAKGGGYTTAGGTLYVGTTYYFSVDKPLYVRTWVTGVVPASTVPSKLLSAAALTPLAQLELKGGDADNSEDVDIPDASCIGGAYGTTGPTWPCGSNSGSSDVNGDGKVDILDLTLMGGNYGLTYSAWTP